MTTAKWVKLPKFCEMTGETPYSIHNKRRSGILVDGVHVRVAGDGNLFVCMPAWERWVETSSPVNKSGDVA